MAYVGAPVGLDDLLFKVKHSLIDQSMASKSRETPTNGDGFGVGWYSRREIPGLYRNVRPAWNDQNLRDMSSQVDAHMFLAHVRATSQAAIQETNCHPFRHGHRLFAHNGEIAEIDKLRRDLVLAVAPELFSSIQGTTDSEVMFYLALTFGLDADPLKALARMAGYVEETARRRGVDAPLWMTLGLCDGQAVWAVRYASDGEAPTLHYSREIGSIERLNPRIAGMLDPSTRVVVSEPIGALVDAWETVPQATAICIHQGSVEQFPFTPEPPERWPFVANA